MVYLGKEEILMFKKLLAYIAEHYTPIDNIYEDKYDLLSSSKPLENDNPFEDVFVLQKINWKAEARKKHESAFCQALLACLPYEFEQLSGLCKAALLPKSAATDIQEKTYSPTKATICRLIIAAKISFEKAVPLFQSAKIHLHNYNKFDVVIEFFLKSEFFDIAVINKLLYILDLPMLGYSFIASAGHMRGE